MNLAKMFYYPSIDDPNLAWKSYYSINYTLEDILKEIKSSGHKNKQIEKFDYSNYLLNNLSIAEKNNLILENVFSKLDDFNYEFQASKFVLESIDQTIYELNSNLINLTQVVNYKLAAIIEQEKISNFLLKHISFLLTVPDIEKEKTRNIEIGLKHFKNAKINETLFNDSLIFFQKAKTIDYTDYIVLHYLGMIYLYGGENINLNEALSHFQDAGKYSEVESNEEASRLVMLLKYNTVKDIDENIPSFKYLKEFAAESYYHASIAAYALKNYSLSKSLAKKSFELNYNFPNAHILFCRASIQENEIITATSHLSVYLFENPYIYDIICNDPVFCNNQDIAFFLKKVKIGFYLKIRNILTKLQEITDGYKISSAVNKTDWIKLLLESYSYFLEDTFEGYVKSYYLIKRQNVKQFKFSQIFDCSKMSPNKRTVSYSSSLNMKCVILSIGYYIVVFIDGIYYKSFATDNNYITDIFITKDDKYVIVSGSSGNLEIYDLKTYLLKETIKTDSYIKRVCVSNDMKKIAVYSDRKIKLFDFDFDTFQYSQKVIYEEINIYHSNITFSNNSRYLAFFSTHNSKVIIYDVVNETIYKTISLDLNSLYLARAIQFSQNDEFVAISGDDGKIFICEIENLKVKILKESEYIVTKLFFNDENNCIVSDSNEEIIVWDIMNAKILHRVKGVNNFIYGIKQMELKNIELDIFDNCYSNFEKYINYDITRIKGGIIKYKVV